jgi:hypothetical protein
MDEHHNELARGFETLQPETSVNWTKSEGPNQQIRLSDEIQTFIAKSEIEVELKDKVRISPSSCFFSLLTDHK